MSTRAYFWLSRKLHRIAAYGMRQTPWWMFAQRASQWALERGTRKAIGDD